MAKILVVDLGTTYFKIALFDRDGRLCDVVRVAPPVRSPSPGYAELDADAFDRVIAEGIARLRHRSPGGLADIDAVTFATQTNSFVLLDAAGRPLTPILLWPDRRGADLEADVRARCETSVAAATTGVPRVPPEFMVAKLLWLQRQSARTWQRTNKLCLISDYLTLRWTGRHVTEAGAAGLTGLLDVHRCRWWPEVLERFAIPPHWLPAVTRAGTDLGPIDARAAETLGLPHTCRFVVGCLDQYAGAIGAGNVEPGLVSETTGTVLATVRCADRFATDLGPDVFQGPAFAENLYYRMVFGSVAANYLEWYRDQLPDRPDFARLTALAADVEPGAGGLKLRTDVELAGARPQEVFEGMTPQHTPGHAVRCIMEAVAHALRDQVANLCSNAPPAEIRSVGGAARNDLWLQIKANVLGIPTAATQCREPTSLGAAILAESALTGHDVPHTARRWVRLSPPHQPQPRPNAPQS